MIALVIAGAMKPVADPTVFVSPFKDPAKFGAISCSEITDPHSIVPSAPTATHITTRDSTLLQSTHIIAINAAADVYMPGE